LSIQAVIFDFGGVLYHLPDRSWMMRWKHLMNIKDESALLSMIASPNESKFLMDILVGKLEEDELWNHFARELKIKPQLMQRIRRSFMTKRRINKPLAAFLSSLRESYKTAILSNAGSDARRIFTEVYEFHKIVDEMIISAEERVAKPDPRIYEIAVNRLEIDPQGAVFVDDFAENIDAARDFGMHAVLYQNNDQVISEVRRILNEGN
jgi:epoxide hydrolase-like predicted phosphatase